MLRGALAVEYAPGDGAQSARDIQSREANEYPGAPLLGVKGTAVILHGSCNEEGVANAIRGACRVAEARVHEHIKEGIADLRAAEAHLKEADEGGQAAQT